jgi:hypothetical protein
MLARRHLFKDFAILVLAFCAQPAWAFLDPPNIMPASPVVGDFISVNIYGGECDVADDGVTWPPPVTREGNAIKILLTGIHEGDPEWCYFGHGGIQTFPIGNLGPGPYTLDVERRYITVFGTWIQETLGVISFTVANAPSQQPADAPAIGMMGLGALVLGLIAATMHRLRERLA